MLRGHPLIYPIFGPFPFLPVREGKVVLSVSLAGQNLHLVLLADPGASRCFSSYSIVVPLDNNGRIVHTIHSLVKTIEKRQICFG